MIDVYGGKHETLASRLGPARLRAQDATFRTLEALPLRKLRSAMEATAP